MKITLSELYGCSPDEEALRLIEEYSIMLGWWAEKAQGFEGRSYAKFRNTYYAAWRERWPDWNSQHAQTSSMVVYSAIQLWRRKPGGPRRLELRVPFAVLSPRIVKVEHGLLRVSTTIRDFGYAELIPNNSYQQKLLEQAEEKLWQLGQVILTPEWTIIPFTKDLDITRERHLELESLLKTS
jgi:transposase